MSEKPKYYLTTPIYYPSAKLHIGNAYPTIVADILKKYKTLRGFDVQFLTGTDEHGQKIEKKAESLNLTPMEYLNPMIDWIKDLWKLLGIDNDIFIRTTDDYHEAAVKKIFTKLYEQGDIYKGEYEGFYCIQCESFFTETQLVDGKCPDCGRDVEKAKEESYFFRLSKYEDRLIKYIEENPSFIRPESRKNEMLSNFIKKGLTDLAVSRTSFTWGIPVDFDPKHVVYVWIDALTNYITALGYMSGDEEKEKAMKEFWPADVHIVGKEIVRFHTIIWPALLMALDLPLPKEIFGHGWLVFNGMKMGKSFGNGVDPNVLVEKFGVDPIRYFLVREIIFGQDGNFSVDALMQRTNSDLSNDLGNLLSRTVSMIEKYFDGTLPIEQKSTEFDEELINLSNETVEKYGCLMDDFNFSEALSQVWTLIRKANKYIDLTMPWTMAKDSEKLPELANVLYNLTEVLRVVSVMVSPIMPHSSNEIFKQLNCEAENLRSWDSIVKFGAAQKNLTVKKGDILFPRIDIEAERAEIAEKSKLAEAEEAKNNPKQASKAPAPEPKPEIGIEDFAKVEMKIGKIIACEKVEKSDKLLKSQIKIGDQTRQIVSGIAKYYSPEQFVGKDVVVVTNLKPVKLRGVLSEGMILAAMDEDGNLKAITTDGEVGNGAVVS